MKITTLRGMNDILPPDIHIWLKVEDSLRQICTRFGFDEIRTPLLEQTALFKRSVGEDTDIVEKEMYSFTDKGGDHVSLRPEGTASVVRCLVEQSWFRANPVSKFYYTGPMFRYERPQKGRFRQFHQFGAELLGVQEPEADVEVISLLHVAFKEFGLKKIELHLSSVGCADCRPAYKKILIAELEKIKDKLPADFLPRIHTNPQRVFDLKDESARALTQSLPMLMDHLCESCQTHFDGVKKGLDRDKIAYVIDPRIVRGLDYYNKTAFEFLSSDLGSQSTVCGGGRYDKLVEEFGGPAVPAVGFGMGMERLVLILQANQFTADTSMDVSIIYADDKGKDKSFQLALELREKGFKVDIELQGKNIKGQFKRADKVGSRLSVVIGEKEVDSGMVALKNMKTQEQHNIAIQDLEIEIKKVRV